MNIREKIQQHTHYDDSSIDRALFKAGGIILAGYLIGTIIAWLISR